MTPSPFVERHNESDSFHLCAAQQVIGHGRSTACLSCSLVPLILNALRSRRSIPALGGLRNWLVVMSVYKHIVSILLLPTVVTVVIPVIILYCTGTVNVGWALNPWLSVIPPFGGLLLIVLGLTLMVKTIALFATVGRGTLAPWAPPERLVVRGIYRHVRNPMISGVLFVLCGEVLFAGSLPLSGWFGTFLLINLIYIPLLEEPGLEERFGEQYRIYKRNVPRWIPRLKPWDAPEGTSS